MAVLVYPSLHVANFKQARMLTVATVGISRHACFTPTGVVSCRVLCVPSCCVLF